MHDDTLVDATRNHEQLTISVTLRSNLSVAFAAAPGESHPPSGSRLREPPISFVHRDLSRAQLRFLFGTMTDALIRDALGVTKKKSTRRCHKKEKHRRLNRRPAVSSAELACSTGRPDEISHHAARATCSGAQKGGWNMTRVEGAPQSLLPKFLACCVTLVVGLVGGSSVSRADALDDAAAQLRPSLVEDVDRALSETKTLGERIAAKDTEGARRAWISARVGWERAEVFTAAFVPDLDEKIDAWPDAKTGFHAIEARLFGGDIASTAGEVGTLVFYLNDLDIKVHDTPLTPQHILNGTARLVYEVGEDKSDGGESRFSGTSLDDMRNNLIGIRSAYETVFAKALSASDAELAKTAETQIGKMETLLQAQDLKSIDQESLRKVSEELVVTLQAAAPKIGLRQPTFQDLIQ